jgi:hypothetical protein
MKKYLIPVLLFWFCTHLAGQVYHYSNPFVSPTENFRIKKEFYTFNEEIEGPSIYRYDQNMLLSTKDFLRSEGDRTKTVYSYDSNRQLIFSTRNYESGGSDRFEYNYNADNRLVRRTCIVADTVAATEYYMYNAAGTVTNARWENYDNWLTGIIALQINENGRIGSGTFKGEDGFDATLTFKYNDLGFVSEIRWDFTFGKFQQYSFEYEPTQLF